MTGEPQPELMDLPEFPECALHVWAWFGQLSQRRTNNGFSINPLTWIEIDAWAKVTGTILRCWEVKAILAIDEVYLEVLRKERLREDVDVS